MPITVDYVGVGYSPLTRDEAAVVSKHLRLRLIPLAWLQRISKAAHPTIYDPGKIFSSELSPLVLEQSCAASKTNPFDYLKQITAPCFLSELNYPRNPLVRLKMLSVAERLRRAYEKAGYPDVLHNGMFSDTTLLTMHLSHRIKRPFTVTMHSSDFMMRGRRRRRYVMKVCRDAKAVVTISEYNKRYLARIGVDPSKVHVIRAGVNLKRLKRSSDYKPSGKVLFVGRLVRYKGLEYLLKAASLLKSKGVKFEVWIVGEGPMLMELKGLAASLRIDDVVKFYGAVPDQDLVRIYEGASVFVHPSVELEDGRKDGVPVSMMEAMAMELPVVSTWCSGIPELVDHHANGILVPQRDHERLAEAVCYLLENPGVAKEYGRGARGKVMRDYNIEVNALKLVELFKMVARGDTA